MRFCIDSPQNVILYLQCMSRDCIDFDCIDNVMNETLGPCIDSPMNVVLY